MPVQTIVENVPVQTAAELREALSQFELKYGKELDIAFSDGLPLIAATCIATRWEDGTVSHEVVLTDESL